MRLIGSVVVAVALACDLPYPPAGAAWLRNPPAAWRAEYAEVATCAGRRGAFDAITWFSVPDGTFTTRKGEADGYWIAPHFIYLAEVYVDQTTIPGWEAYGPAERAAIVALATAKRRHEMLHDLLGAAGHPVPPFCACAAHAGCP